MSDFPGCGRVVAHVETDGDSGRAGADAEARGKRRGRANCVEAENAIRTGITVTTAVAGFSGTGYVTGFDATGDNVRWSFSASNGLYNLRIRFRSQYGEKGFDATLNGVTSSGMFPQSTAFATFDAGLVELTNGNNTLQIGGGWNYYEIDRADLIFTNAPAAAARAGDTRGCQRHVRRADVDGGPGVGLRQHHLVRSARNQ